MLTPDGKPITSHSTSLVPFIAMVRSTGLGTSVVPWNPHSPAFRALRPRQLSPSSSMRHRCRLPTTAQRRRCCCPRAQCRPHEAFSSSSSRWHAAPAGVCTHCNRAVRLRRVVKSCVMLVCRSETSFILQSMQTAEAACQKVDSRVRHFAGVDVSTVLKLVASRALPVP